MLPAADDADLERVDETTTDIEGESRKVWLYDADGDGEAELAVLDRDGDEDVDPVCGQFKVIHPALEWEAWQAWSADPSRATIS